MIVSSHEGRPWEVGGWLDLPLLLLFAADLQSNEQQQILDCLHSLSSACVGTARQAFALTSTATAMMTMNESKIWLDLTCYAIDRSFGSTTTTTTVEIDRLAAIPLQGDRWHQTSPP